MVTVKSFSLIYDNKGLESFKCLLVDGQLFYVEICTFYQFLINKDNNLLKYSEKFQNWDELTQDLISLEFPLTNRLESYINTQFTEDDIIEFTYS